MEWTSLAQLPSAGPITRRDDVGFVFQFYNLVANLTAKENVELASEIVKDAMDPHGHFDRRKWDWAIDSTIFLPVSAAAARVAIARAVAKKKILLLRRADWHGLPDRKQGPQILQDMALKQGYNGHHRDP